MPYYRFILLVTLSFLVFAVSGPQAQQPAQPAKPAPAAPPPKADEGATKALDQAIAALTPPKPQVIRTTFRERAVFQGMNVRAEGTYLSGPGNQVRLELQVDWGGPKGRLRIFSDGKTYWRVFQVGSDDEYAHRVDLKQLMEALNQPDVPATVRDTLFRQHAFTGLKPLLESLRKGMTFIRKESVRTEGRDAIKLIGVWTQTPPAGRSWPPYMPSQCHLYLDPQTAWPFRLEWWGLNPPQAGDSLLLRMDFGNPEVNASVPADAFTFEPGKAKVVDGTADFLQRVRSAARGAAAAKPEEKGKKQ